MQKEKSKPTKIWGLCIQISSGSTTTYYCTLVNDTFFYLYLNLNSLYGSTPWELIASTKCHEEQVNLSSDSS